MAEITKWVKKIWKNRTTEFPTRRTLMKEDGSSEIVTVTRNEGTVSEEGDAFDADTMNNLEERIDAGFAELNGKLDNPTEELIAILSEAKQSYTFKTVDLSKYRKIIVENHYVSKEYNTINVRSEISINRFINECNSNESRLSAGGAYIFAVDSNTIGLYQAENNYQTYVYGQLK